MRQGLCKVTVSGRPHRQVAQGQERKGGQSEQGVPEWGAETKSTSPGEDLLPKVCPGFWRY